MWLHWTCCFKLLGGNGTGGAPTDSGSCLDRCSLRLCGRICECLSESIQVCGLGTGADSAPPFYLTDLECLWPAGPGLRSVEGPGGERGTQALHVFCIWTVTMIWPASPAWLDSESQTSVPGPAQAGQQLLQCRAEAAEPSLLRLASSRAHPVPCRQTTWSGMSGPT